MSFKDRLPANNSSENLGGSGLTTIGIKRKVADFACLMNNRCYGEVVCWPNVVCCHYFWHLPLLISKHSEDTNAIQKCKKPFTVTLGLHPLLLLSSICLQPVRETEVKPSRFRWTLRFLREKNESDRRMLEQKIQDSSREEASDRFRSRLASGSGSGLGVFGSPKLTGWLRHCAYESPSKVCLGVCVCVCVPDRFVPHATLPPPSKPSVSPSNTSRLAHQSRFTSKDGTSRSRGTCVCGINSNCVCKQFHISPFYYNSCPANHHRLRAADDFSACVCACVPQ